MQSFEFKRKEQSNSNEVKIRYDKVIAPACMSFISN